MKLSLILEILDFAFVLRSLLPGCKCSNVSPLSGEGSFLREYSRYSPDFSFRIMRKMDAAMVEKGSLELQLDYSLAGDREPIQ